MSDVLEVTADAKTDTKPNRANARTDFTKIIAKHAQKRGIDPTRAGKEVRAFTRKHYSALVKLDSGIAKAKPGGANDGNRWPALNAKATAYVLKRGKV